MLLSLYSLFFSKSLLVPIVKKPFSIWIIILIFCAIMVKYSLDSTPDSDPIAGDLKNEEKKKDPMAKFFREK